MTEVVTVAQAVPMPRHARLPAHVRRDCVALVADAYTVGFTELECRAALESRGLSAWAVRQCVAAGVATARGAMNRRASLVLGTARAAAVVAELVGSKAAA